MPRSGWQFNEFLIEKSVDTLSRALFSISAKGIHLPYGFGTVFISKIDWSAPVGDDATERVNFTYGGLTVGIDTETPDRQLSSRPTLSVLL